MSKKGIGIIFHSGSFDRLSHGVNIALSALAMGWEAKFFFTYWALEYLRKGKESPVEFDSEGERYKDLITRNIKEGHISSIHETFAQAKQMGAKFYACTNSMALLNVTRDELVDIVDLSMGITTFLAEIEGYISFFI